MSPLLLLLAAASCYSHSETPSVLLHGGNVVSVLDRNRAIVPPKPISTTVSVPTTVPTTVCTPVHTPEVDLKAPEFRCWLDNAEILYISLAFVSGILSTVLVFAIIYLFRKRCKRSRQPLQGQGPSQTATEESEKNVQNEVAYTTLVFQRSRTPVAV